MVISSDGTMAESFSLQYNYDYEKSILIVDPIVCYAFFQYHVVMRPNVTKDYLRLYIHCQGPQEYDKNYFYENARSSSRRNLIPIIREE